MHTHFSLAYFTISIDTTNKEWGVISLGAELSSRPDCLGAKPKSMVESTNSWYHCDQTVLHVGVCERRLWSNIVQSLLLLCVVPLVVQSNRALAQAVEVEAKDLSLLCPPGMLVGVGVPPSL